MPPPVFFWVFSFFCKSQIATATVCGSKTAWCRGWASVGACCLVRKPARGYPLGLCWSRSARTGRDVVEQAPHGGRLAHAHCLAGSSLRCDDAPRGAPLRRDCVGQRPLLLAGSCTGDRRLPHGRAQRCVSCPSPAFLLCRTHVAERLHTRLCIGWSRSQSAGGVRLLQAAECRFCTDQLPSGSQPPGRTPLLLDACALASSPADDHGERGAGRKRRATGWKQG